MRLIMLLGPAHGTVVNSDETPHQLSLPKREPVKVMTESSCKLGFETVTYTYVLIAHGPEEAYYVPQGFSKLQVIKGLLESQ